MCSSTQYVLASDEILYILIFHLGRMITWVKEPPYYLAVNKTEANESRARCLGECFMSVLAFHLKCFSLSVSKHLVSFLFYVISDIWFIVQCLDNLSCHSEKQ